MGVNVYFVSDENAKIAIDDQEVHDVLSSEEEPYAVEINEIYTAIVSVLKPNIESESDLEIEITGSSTIKGNGEAKIICINIGAAAENTDTLRILFKTKIKPS